MSINTTLVGLALGFPLKGCKRKRDWESLQFTVMGIDVDRPNILECVVQDALDLADHPREPVPDDFVKLMHTSRSFEHIKSTNEYTDSVFLNTFSMPTLARLYPLLKGDDYTPFPYKKQVYICDKPFHTIRMNAAKACLDHPTMGEKVRKLVNVCMFAVYLERCASGLTNVHAKCLAAFGRALSSDSVSPYCILEMLGMPSYSCGGERSYKSIWDSLRKMLN